MLDHSSSLVTIPFPNQLDDLIAVRLSAQAATLAVDEMATMQVTLINRGQISGLFELEVLGLHANWLIIPDLKLNLAPGQQKNYSLHYQASSAARKSGRCSPLCNQSYLNGLSPTILPATSHLNYSALSRFFS